MYPQTGAVSGHCSIKAAFIFFLMSTVANLTRSQRIQTQSGCCSTPHSGRFGSRTPFYPTWPQQSEWDLVEKATHQQQEHCEWDGVQTIHLIKCDSDWKACVAPDRKWVMQEHLKGVLWNSKNSFTGNWISNDTKWKWSCESGCAAAQAHVPTIPLRRLGDAGGQWSQGSSKQTVPCENHNWMCFIKLYGCLMMP